MPSRVGRGGDGGGTSSLTELAQLADSDGLDVVGQLTQAREPRPSDLHRVGSGRRAGAAGRRGRCRGGDSFAEHARSRSAGKTARATGVPAAPFARGRTGAV